jgi:hypothetical protein
LLEAQGLSQVVSEGTRLDVDGAGYAVGLSPLWLQGWQLAIVVPEAEFLGPIDETIRNAAIGLVLFVLMASLIGILAGRRFVALPIARVVDDIALIERFELEGGKFQQKWKSRPILTGSATQAPSNCWLRNFT